MVAQAGLNLTLSQTPKTGFLMRRLIYIYISVFQLSDAASETMVEFALADTVYHVENEGKLPEF